MRFRRSFRVRVHLILVTSVLFLSVQTRELPYASFSRSTDDLQLKYSERGNVIVCPTPMRSISSRVDDQRWRRKRSVMVLTWPASGGVLRFRGAQGRALNCGIHRELLSASIALARTRLPPLGQRERLPVRCENAPAQGRVPTDSMAVSRIVNRS